MLVFKKIGKIIHEIIDWIDRSLFSDPKSSNEYYMDYFHETDTLYDMIFQLKSRVDVLEQKVTALEEENVSTTNELYRLENSLDSRIDILTRDKLFYE